MSDSRNYEEVSFLKAVEDGRPVRSDTKISVTKIIEGFQAFGTVEEGHIVGILLKGIGTYD